MLLIAIKYWTPGGILQVQLAVMMVQNQGASLLKTNNPQKNLGKN